MFTEVLTSCNFYWNAYISFASKALKTRPCFFSALQTRRTTKVGDEVRSQSASTLRRSAAADAHNTKLLRHSSWYYKDQGQSARTREYLLYPLGSRHSVEGGPYDPKDKATSRGNVSNKVVPMPVSTNQSKAMDDKVNWFQELPQEVVDYLREEMEKSLLHITDLYPMFAQYIWRIVAIIDR